MLACGRFFVNLWKAQKFLLYEKLWEKFQKNITWFFCKLYEINNDSEQIFLLRSRVIGIDSDPKIFAQVLNDTKTLKPYKKHKVMNISSQNFLPKYHIFVT
jgi:hypothetical protein